MKTLTLLSVVLVAGCGHIDMGGADNGADGALGGADLAPAAPNIATAVSCGATPPVGQGTQNAMQRYVFDTTVFPDALCNDGSPAVLYFRPYRGEANRDKWEINLHGGGSCHDANSCLARWCGCTDANKCPYVTEPTNFNRLTMVNDGPPTLDDSGLFRRDDVHANPLADYNHIELEYCSSDSWRGTQHNVVLDGVHPMTGAPVTYTVNFLGARIVDAALATLRQEGVAALTYTHDGASTPLPSLASATDLVLTGDSAGGAGVIFNLDYVASTLPSAKVVGVLDAIIGPDISLLDYSTYVDPTVRSYEQLVAKMNGFATNQNARGDASCAAWHAAHAPDTADECGDMTHVVRHHVTTPFFVRMALGDQLISGNYIESGFRDSTLGAMTLKVFALLVHGQLAQFGNLPTTAEEGAAMTKAPGVFAPACAKHDTIHDDGETFATTITPSGGSALNLPAVLGNWLAGATPANVLTESPMLADTMCAK